MTLFKTLFVSNAIALVVCSLCADLQGQRFQFQMRRQVQAGGAMAGMFRNGVVVAHTPEQMEKMLVLRIEEIKDASNIDEKQTRKLSLAAKVVSKKVFQERNNPLLAPFGQSKKMDVGDSFSDEDSESNEDQRNSMEKKLKEIVVPVPISTALRHAIWKKSQQSILTDDQQSAVEQYDERRTKHTRDVAVEYRVWQLARQLRLRTDQIEAISEIVDRIEGDQLVEQMNQRQGLSMIILKAGGKESKPVEADDLKDVLDEPQLELFKSNSEGGRRFRRPSLQKGLSNEGSNSKFGVELKPGEMVVQRIASNSKAEKLGVQVGDIIDEVNDTPVDTLIQIKSALKKESETSITVIRDGKVIRLESQ